MMLGKRLFGVGIDQNNLYSAETTILAETAISAETELFRPKKCVSAEAPKE